MQNELERILAILGFMAMGVCIAIIIALRAEEYMDEFSSNTFSFLYPAGWKTYTTKGVDYELDGVLIFPKGGLKVPPQEVKVPRDVTGQAIRVRATAVLTPYEDVRTWQQHEQLQDLNISGTVLEKQQVTIGEQPGLLITWLDEEHDVRGLTHLRLARPDARVPTGSVLVAIEYMATQRQFSQDLADRIILSFEENVMERLLERRRRR